MSSQKDYFNKLADDLEKEIEFSLLQEMLESKGWTAVVFDPFDYNRNAAIIEQWARAHCTGRWSNWNVKFVFEKAEDATCAVLKWQ